MTRPPVVVVGGGISGLAAAFQLQRDGMPVRLFESDLQVGGKIRNSMVAGRLVDEAADAFLARVPHAIELAKELGLESGMIAPTARKAQVWTSQGLMRLPEPHVLGIPLKRESAEALLGVAAADAVEADLARTEPDPVRDDDTIGSLVRRRLGDQIHEALVDPLIGAINAGDTDELALAASSPQILAAAMAGPSLIGSLQAMAAKADREAPVFHSFERGMPLLVDALEASLGDVITSNARVESVIPVEGGLRVSLADREPVDASAVVLACPPPVAADLTRSWAPAAEALAAIPLVSVTLVTLAYPAGTLEVAPDLSGFVVPRESAELRITACSFATQKWPHLAGDVELLRVSVGHGRDQVTPALPDAELLHLIRDDLATAIGLSAEPSDVRISRWERAFPQYVVGHLDRLARIEGHLNPDGVFIAGMGYRGIGIPACIDQGRSAAVEAILHVLDEARDE